MWQTKYRVSQLPTRELHIEFNVLNSQNRQIASLVGVATDGDISIDAQSTHRRTGSIEILLNDEKYIPSPLSPIWFNNRCQIQVGITDLDDDIVWFDLGVFAFADVSIDNKHSHSTMSCRLLDYMAFLDGTLGGTISHQVLIEAGQSTIREAIMAILDGDDYVVVSHITTDEQTSALVPYDVETPTNTTKYEILRELVELYSGYEMFINTNGYLVIKEIANTKYDYPVEVFGDGANFDFTIEAGGTIDFTNVKNEVWVWGYLDDKTGEQAKFRCSNQGSVLTHNILKTVNANEGDIYYVESNKKFYILMPSKGWTIIENLPINPYLSVTEIGVKKKVVDDNNIVDNQQAYLRSLYELEQSSNMAESISITTIPLYYLDVNDKILINYDNMQGEYLIQSISFGLGIDSDMSISATKIY